MLLLDPWRWSRAAGSLKSESLVFLTRYIRDTNDIVCGELMLKLRERTIRTAYNWIYDVYETAMDILIYDVEMEVTQLILAKTVSRRSEILEIAFGQFVARRTLNAVKKFKKTPMGQQGQVVADPVDGDGDEIERPIEFAADTRPGAADIFLRNEHVEGCRKMIEQASSAVKDRRHLKAAVLRYVEGLSMTKLAGRFERSTRQMQNWLNTALQQMEQALAGEVA